MDIKNSVVAILNDRNKVIGTGFVAGENLILTCAHVVEQATVGLNERVTVQFADNFNVAATVDQAAFSPSYERDVALLRLDSVPGGIMLLPLGNAAGSAGHDFYAYGYAIVTDVQGIGARGKIVDIVDNGRLVQLNSQEPDHGMSGGPVWDEQRRIVIGMVTKGKGLLEKGQNLRNTQTTFATSVEVVREVCPALQLTEICPYRSLQAFNEEDAPFFFGRERTTHKLIDSLKKEPRFLAVLGPSGSGKSSLLRAGLIPALRQGGVPGSQKWGIVTIRPSNDPFAQLAAAGFANLKAGLEASVNTWLADRPEITRLLLFIDQFEEVLLSTPPAIRQDFFNGLVQLLDSSAAISVALTLRDDFYSCLLQEAPALAGWLERGLVNAPTVLEKDELLAIISEPARAAGLSLEPGLLEALLKDASEAGPASGAVRSTILPLLEFSLAHLWEGRRYGRLLYAVYQSLGGLSGSISQWADQAFYALPREQQPLARDVLTRLARVEFSADELRSATRRRLYSDEFNADPAIQAILTHFSNHRLVASGSENRRAYSEFIHEAVLREWALLKQFLRDDRAFLLWRQALQESLQIWHSHQRDPGDLFRGKRLEESVVWLSNRRSALNAGELEFLRESLELDKKETSEARPERARMRKISMTLSLVCLAIYYPFVILQAWPRVNQRGSGVFSILVSTLLFAFIALTTSYFFADWMTRLDRATRGLPLRLLAMGALGGLVGAPLFLGVAGQFALWYIGLLLGLALAVYPLVPTGRVILALALAGLTVGLALATLAGVPEIFWPQKLASALSAGCFCGVYLYVATDSGAGGDQRKGAHG